MDTLESRLQKRMHISLYALLFLTVLLGLSIVLEGCSDSDAVKHPYTDASTQYTYYEPVQTVYDVLRSGTEDDMAGKTDMKDGIRAVRSWNDNHHREVAR